MKTEFKKWLITVFAFICFFYLYSLFSYFGIEHFVQNSLIKTYFDSNAWHIEILVAGVLFGTLFTLINRLTEIKIFRKRSFGFNILLKSILYIISLGLVFILIFYFFSVFNIISQELIDNFNTFLSLPLILSFTIYCLLFVFLINFINSVSQKFGPGLLFDLLTGKYYHPRSDELIFMFLDLKDSTRITEKLGHSNYSRFIKECIHELTPVILKYEARVYQYVGDEVILYWKIKTGVKQLNCLNAFFAFAEILEKQASYFNSTYREAPTFKAGMDTGIVTLTEIGDIKREIAFHGDVLNTAARLEKKCNEFGEHFIISERVLEKLDRDNAYQFKLLSDLPLRGKTESLKFYAVNR
jgi:adenylate cyclase